MDNLCLLVLCRVTVLPIYGQSLSSSSVLGYCTAIPWTICLLVLCQVTVFHDNLCLYLLDSEVPQLSQRCTSATHSSFLIHLKAFSTQFSQPFCSSFALDIHNLWTGPPCSSKFSLPECFACSVSPCHFNFTTTQWCKTVLHKETRQHSTVHMIFFCCSLLLFRGFVYYTVCFL